MAYWLVKSEPSSWSWDQQVAKGAKGEAWTGVRNFTARQNLVNMKKGDKAFFYHSNEGKEIVGIAEIIKEAYPDPTDTTGKFVCVDIKADKPLKTPVTMAAIKAEKKLADMALVKYSRLSVQPVTAEEWKLVCKMGGTVKLRAEASKAVRGMHPRRQTPHRRYGHLSHKGRRKKEVTPPRRSPPAPAIARAWSASGCPSWSRQSAPGCRPRTR